MKKLLSSAFAMAVLMCSAADSVKTNYVYIVSNIFNNVYTETYITQNVKNTHFNYYYTNNVYTVSNVVLKVFETNFHYEVINQNFDPWVNQAKTYAQQASSSASQAGSYASSASSTLRSINDRLAWFEANMGREVLYLDHASINVSNEVSRPYVDLAGVEYPNIIFFYQEQANGKVSVGTAGNFYASTEYVFYPEYGGNATTANWRFRPAWVDSDVYGMKLNYLPTTTNTIASSWSQGGRQYVPRAFYWQAGKVYVIIDCYTGKTWYGRIKMMHDPSRQVVRTYDFPNAFEYFSQDSSVNSYQYMSYVSREGQIMGSNTYGNFGRYKTAYQQRLNGYNDVLMFPSKPTIEQQMILDWINSYTR